MVRNENNCIDKRKIISILFISIKEKRGGNEEMKKMISLITLCFVLLSNVVIVPNQAEAAKTGFINNKNFRGTFSLEGYKNTFESGGYEVVIANISSKGTVKLQMHRWSANAGRMSDTEVITAKIKNKKLCFTFKDGYDGSTEKATIVFNKNKTLSVKVKVMKKGEYSGYNMEIKNSTFKRISKKHKLG